MRMFEPKWTRMDLACRQHFVRFVSLLCLASGSALCVSPARCESGDTVTITSWTSDAPARPLHAGEKFTATLIGTVGGKARMCVPGVVSNIALREVQPGKYVGSLTVPKNVSVTGAALVGILSLGKIVAPLVQAGSVTLDSRAPTVDAVYPPKGATSEDTVPVVSALLSDAGGSGIDPASVHLTIDGADRTKTALVTPTSVTLRPGALSAGPHSASVSATDLAGNTRTVSWSWTAEPPSVVQSFTSDAPADGLLPAGRTVRFTLRTTTNGKVRVFLGTAVADVVLAQGRVAGLYTGEYTVQTGDMTQNALVVAHVQAGGGHGVFVALPQSFSLSGDRLRRPRIMFPPDDVYVAETIEMAGEAEPGSEVLVTASFTSTGAGGAFPLSGTAASQAFRADKGGKWQTDDLSLAADPALLSKEQTTVWTLSAQSVASDGTLSDPISIKVRRG